MYLLDTDTLTHLFVGNTRVVDRLQKLADSDVRTTVVSRIEILRGRFDYVLKSSDAAELLRATQYLASSEEFLNQMSIIAFDPDAAKEFDRLRTMKKLKKIGRGDLLIACIALASRATVVTRNVKDFKQVPNLKVENWID